MNEINKTEIISIRRTNEIDEILTYLKSKLMISQSSIIRLGLVRLYEIEKDNEKITGGR